jgi:hypothetical protein
VSSSVPASAPIPAGLPGWRRAACLGCSRRVVQARDGWVTVGGTRSGSYLILWGAEPLRTFVTDPGSVPDDQLFVLGIAHARCIDAARTRLESGTVELPSELPRLQAEMGAHVSPPMYTLDRPAQIDACPFCDSQSNLTREHVWPNWYSRELQARGAILIGDVIVDNRIEVTVPVCEGCNNRWMAVLEDDCKKLMMSMANAATKGNSPIELSAEAQARLATWAVKTAYLIDACQASLVPRGFLHQLALQRAPNPWTAIWVAAYIPDSAARADKRALDFLTQAGEASGNCPNAFSVTFTILNIVFQVAGHFNGGKWTLHDDRQQYEDALFRIWPDPAPRLSWPPAFGFNRDSWDGLIASIRDRSG